jgi:hypothetical protein
VKDRAWSGVTVSASGKFNPTEKGSAMTTTPQRAFEDSTKGAFAYGMTIFAAVMLVTVGLFQSVAGLAALFDDEFFVTTPNYTFQFDLTTWGWAHLAIGILAVAVGVALFMRQSWAMITGIALAVLSALANFLFLPYYPLWAIVIIAFDVTLIWALTAQLKNR